VILLLLQEITGGALSTTVTVKDVVAALLVPSVPVNVTVVTPLLKVKELLPVPSAIVFPEEDSEVAPVVE